jgi:hypothetical protein
MRAHQLKRLLADLMMENRLPKEVYAAMAEYGFSLLIDPARAGPRQRDSLRTTIEERPVL